MACIIIAVYSESSPMAANTKIAYEHFMYMYIYIYIAIFGKERKWINKGNVFVNPQPNTGFYSTQIYIRLYLQNVIRISEKINNI